MQVIHSRLRLTGVINLEIALLLWTICELGPAGHFVDSAYVDAALLVESLRDHGVLLEGPVRGIAKR